MKELNSPTETANQLHRSVLQLIRLLRTDRPGKTELSWSKLSVLGRLHRQGQATATDLAAYLRVQPQSLTRLLADLEKSGLITRQPNQADRRQNMLEITKKGVKELLEDISGQRQWLAEVIAVELTPVEADLLWLATSLMDRLAAAVEARAAKE